MADINVCSVRKLSATSGISVSMAKKIAQLRKRKSPFRDFDELWEIKGMNRNNMKILKKNFVINKNHSKERSAKKYKVKGKGNRTPEILKTAAGKKLMSESRLQNTPVTVILPVCSKRSDDFQILAPQTLQKSQSGNKLTAVYQITNPNSTITTSTESKLDKFSTTVQPPSMFGRNCLSSVPVKTLSPAKKRSIEQWLNHIPEKINNRISYKVLSSPAAQPLLADDKRCWTPQEQKNRLNSKSPKSRSRSRKRVRSESNSRSNSRSKSRDVTHSKYSKLRERSLSKERKSRKRSSGSKRRSGHRSRKDAYYSMKENSWAKSENLREDKKALLNRSENDEGHDANAAMLTLHDLETSADDYTNKEFEAVYQNKDTINSGLGNAFVNKSYASQVDLRTPDTITVRRQERESSQTRELPNVSRRSTWKRNEEWEMRRSRDRSSERQNRRHKRREHRRHTRQVSDQHETNCIIL